VTGIQPENQNTVLDVDETISSLTVNDPAAVTISGQHTLTITGTGVGSGITINSGAGLTTINSNLQLSGLSRAITVNNAAGLVLNGILGGTIGLTKAGIGQLTLTGANTDSGGTTVSGGVLSVAGDSNLGNVSGGLTLDGGELLTTGSGFIALRSVTLTANGGTLAAAAAGRADFEGNITGGGPLVIGDPVNTGTVQLSGTNSYLGSTTLVSGVTLQALSSGALSSRSAFILNGTLDLDGFSNQSVLWPAAARSPIVASLRQPS
jgi:fibronectin-binding autotransporter adhesin